jgi:hypothetical protein
MKRMIFVALLLLAFALVAANGTPAQKTLTGTLIDNMCATANAANLATFVNTHTKSCATAECCVASGYSFFSDGKLLPLDPAGSAKAAAFLKIKGSTLQVVVKGSMADGKLHVESIANAPVAAK